MLAITRSFPPQLRQISMSMANTRLRRCAHVIARCRSLADGSANFEELSRRPPVAGAVWKANLNRWDGVEPDRRMSIWSDPLESTAWPHVPGRFGELVFVD